MRWLCGALFALLLIATRSHAQEAVDPSRVHFERGVLEASAGHWPEAAAAFEAALADADRPAIRYNLVLAYEALGRAADVERHALAFLTFPDEPHRAEARKHVEQALERARRTLPSGAGDASPDSSPRAQVSPEVPAIPPSASASGAPSGAPSTLPSSISPEALPPPRWRTRLAWSFGVMGASLASAAVVSYALAVQRADELSHHDPYMRGFLSSSDSYLRVTSTITPLAITGAALMAAAVPLGPESTRQRSSVWAWTSLALATAAMSAGVALASIQPDQIGNSRDLEHPTRHAGALLIGAALPLFSYAGTFAQRRHHERRDRSTWQASRASRP